MAENDWLAKTKAEIDALLQNMRDGKPLERSPEMNELARRVVAATEERERREAAMTPEELEKDIHEWAARLADDMCRFTD